MGINSHDCAEEDLHCDLRAVFSKYHKAINAHIDAIGLMILKSAQYNDKEQLEKSVRSLGAVKHMLDKVAEHISRTENMDEMKHEELHD